MITTRTKISPATALYIGLRGSSSCTANTRLDSEVEQDATQASSDPCWMNTPQFFVEPVSRINVM